MWVANKYDLQMAEGDYGISLPITISGITFSQTDYVKIVIKKSLNSTTILEKDFTSITENTVNLELTEAESSLLPVGKYVYRLDIYQDGAFMCNVIPIASIKVVDKA